MKNVPLRLTRARAAVRKALERAARPLSHQEVTAALGRALCDRVTVYRALSALEASGLLHRVQGPDGVWRFRANQPAGRENCGGNHAHFLCGDCGRMFCLPGQPLPWLKPPKGAVIAGKQFVAHGRCAACAAGKAGGKK